MTIVLVRIDYGTRDSKRTLQLNRTHWAFAEWFKLRLKPIRERLRGPEVKGVNIVAFGLVEWLPDDWPSDTWLRGANRLSYHEVHDLQPLSQASPLENIKKLMPWAASRAAVAPWPQVRALEEVLAKPLSPAEEASLLPFLRWPRRVA